MKPEDQQKKGLEQKIIPSHCNDLEQRLCLESVGEMDDLLSSSFEKIK